MVSYLCYIVTITIFSSLCHNYYKKWKNMNNMEIFFIADSDSPYMIS